MKYLFILFFISTDLMAYCRPTWKLGLKCFKAIENTEVSEASLSQIDKISFDIEFELEAKALATYLFKRKISFKELSIDASIDSQGETKKLSLLLSPSFKLKREDGYIVLDEDSEDSVKLNLSKVDGDLSLWLRLSLKKFLNESQEIREELEELCSEFVSELNLII